MFTNNNSNRGFTLLELIVAIGIFTLIIGSITAIMTDAFRNNRIIWKQLERQADGRKVLQQVTNDLRRAEQSSTGAYAIEYAGASEIRFYTNLDADGFIEKVRFFLVGTTLKRGIIKPSGTPLVYNPANEQVVDLAVNVTNLNRNIAVFEYFDENYSGSQAALTQPVTAPAVRMIKVFLELEDDPDKTPVALSVQSMVAVRGLKVN